MSKYDDAQAAPHCPKPSVPEDFACSDARHVPIQKWTTTEPYVLLSKTHYENGKSEEGAQLRPG